MTRPTASPRLIQRWAVNLDDHVIALAPSPDAAQHIALASVSGPVLIVHRQTGEIVHRFAGHRPGTLSLGWRRDGQILASGGQDGMVRLWDVAVGTEWLALEAGSAWVQRVAFAQTTDLLVSGAGRKLRLWDGSGGLERDYPDLPGTVNDLAWKPGGKVFAVATNRQLAIFGPDADDPTHKLELAVPMLALAWSPDGKVIVTGNQNGTMNYWRYRHNENLQMSGYPMKVRELAWDSSGRYLASGGGSTVVVWDTSGKGPRGTTPHMLELHEVPIEVLAYQPAGVWLASGDGDGLLAIWQPSSSKTPLAKLQLPAGLACLAWLPGGNQLVVGCADGTAMLLDV
jgi:WD40 repeat protein